MSSTHRITELVCAGVAGLGEGTGDATQVADDDAVRHPFIPPENLSAVLVSGTRILFIGGITADGRTLPFSVLRHLDLADVLSGKHGWVAPISLRSKLHSSHTRVNGHDATSPAFPVARSAHKLTRAPNGYLYLIGGLKQGGDQHGNASKTIFALKVKTELWTRAEASKDTGCNGIGPRSAHSVVHFDGLPNSTSKRHGSGVLLLYGGYSSSDDAAPASSVHAFNITKKRWDSLPVKEGAAPTLAYHAAALLHNRCMVVHGGNNGEHNDCMDMSGEMHVFDVKTQAWIQPVLLRNSCTPPGARRQHSAVNGIGPQSGCAVFFGGECETGQCSSR